jgi:tetratricopeptide (TPR) repeat protein
MRFAMILLTSIVLAGCQGLQLNSEVKGRLDAQLQVAENLLERGDFKGAENLFRQYEASWNYSIYRLRAQVGMARALEGQNQFAAAVKIYNGVIETAANRYPDIVGLASFYVSFCHQALDEGAKTFASLKDAEGYSRFLTQEMSMAEIPARLAAYYNRIGDQKKAQEYFQKAEKGVNLLYSHRDEKDKEAKARLYYLMGNYNTSHVDSGNFETSLGSLATMQVFSLRSIEVGHPTWSRLASEGLQKNYRDIWDSILTFHRNDLIDPLAADQDLRERQVAAIGNVLKNIELLRLYKTTARLNEFSESLLTFLDSLERSGRKAMVTAGLKNPITSEAAEKQSLKRSGVVHSPPVFDSEKEAKEKNDKRPKPEDPNI